MEELTLVLIKPDAVEKNVWFEIIQYYLNEGLKILKAKLFVRMDLEMAEAFYVDHQGKCYFDELISHMTSGLVIALLITGENAIQKVRELNGATNPAVAKTGTIRHKYGEPNGGPKNAVHGSDSKEDAGREIAMIFGRNALTAMVVETEFLRLISGGQKLTIDATDGKEILANANSIFVHIDSVFRNWGTNKSSQATVETEVCVYEMIKDANFEQLFHSFNLDLKKLCLTQAQIIWFVEKYSSWLRTNGNATLFLYELRDPYDRLAVAVFNAFSNGKIYVRELWFIPSLICHASCRHRVVIPQI